MKQLLAQWVLALLRRVARTRAGFIVSVHAHSRSTQRAFTRQDLIKAFETASHAEEQDGGTWLIRGVDDDGALLTVIIAVGPGDRVEVITAF